MLQSGKAANVGRNEQAFGSTEKRGTGPCGACVWKEGDLFGIPGQGCHLPKGSGTRAATAKEMVFVLKEHEHEEE